MYGVEPPEQTNAKMHLSKEAKPEKMMKRHINFTVRIKFYQFLKLEFSGATFIIL